jgi:hypothetical protein
VTRFLYSRVIHFPLQSSPVISITAFRLTPEYLDIGFWGFWVQVQICDGARNALFQLSDNGRMVRRRQVGREAAACRALFAYNTLSVCCHIDGEEN